MNSDSPHWNYIEYAKKTLQEADQHHEAGELDEALRKCDRALDIDPGSADAYTLKGIILEDSRI